MKKTWFLMLALWVAGYTFAQTADDVINKHIQAIGGADAWKKVNSLVTTGSLKVQNADIIVIQTVLQGKGYRQDFSIMGTNNYQIVTPDAGWNFLAFRGQKAPEPITADELKESQEQLDAQGNLIDYKAKGHTAEFLGTEDVDGVDALKLKMTLKSGKVETMYFDPKTYFIMRVISKQKANGKEENVTTNLSNYQKLPEGIMFPLSVTLPYGELVLSKVEINKPIDESIFKPSK